MIRFIIIKYTFIELTTGKILRCYNGNFSFPLILIKGNDVKSKILENFIPGKPPGKPVQKQDHDNDH